MNEHLYRGIQRPHLFTDGELHDACVTMRTIIDRDVIHYEVEVGGYCVWIQECPFGTPASHRAAGDAFVEIAREQQRIGHMWADRILEAQKK